MQIQEVGNAICNDAVCGAGARERFRTAEILHQEIAERPRSRAQFSIGESIKVISGPLSDFSGEISEVNEDQQKLKVLV
jgi:transcription antitermination factor NusG